MSRFDRYVQDNGGAPRSRFDRFATGARTDNGHSMSRLEAFGSGAGDAISFGFGDELQGLVFGPEAEAAARSRQERARAEHPLTYTAGQLGGGMLGGGVAGAGARLALRGVPALAALAANMGPMSRIGAAALTGAAGGGAYAAGDANGGEADILGGALAGGAVGGVGQGVLGELAPRIGGAIQRGMSPDARASHMMGGMMERYGQSPTALRTALQDAPDNAILGDVVAGGPSVIQGAGARPGAARDALREFYDERNNAMAQRGAGMIDRHLLGGAGEDTATALNRLEGAQRTQAAPLYAQVHAGTVQTVPRPLQDFITFNDRQGARFRPALEATRETMRRTMGADATDQAMQRSPLFWHRLLENVQAEVGASIRGAQMTPLAAPRGSAIADMTGDAATFNRQVRHLLGAEFRQAQDIYAGSARAQDAIELGYEAVSPNLNSLKLAQLQRRMRRMSQGELDHFRLAAANRLKDLIFSADTGTGRADVLRQISRNAGQRRVLEQVFNQGDLGNLMRDVEQQRGLVQNSVNAGIGVNSHTAPLLLAHQSQQALTNPTRGGIKDAVLRMLTGDIADRYDERVSNQILQTMQMRPADALAELNATGNVGQRRGLLSAAMRQAQRGRADRPRRAVQALTGGLYAPIGGNALAGYAGGY